MCKNERKELDSRYSVGNQYNTVTVVVAAYFNVCNKLNGKTISPLFYLIIVFACQEEFPLLVQMSYSFGMLQSVLTYVYLKPFLILSIILRSQSEKISVFKILKAKECVWRKERRKRAYVLFSGIS